VFGARTGTAAAAHAAEQAAMPYLDPTQIGAAERDLEAPLERTEGEDPYAIQRDLQDTMQRLVGIFRVEADLVEALDRLAELRGRAANIKVVGGRAYNPGWNLVFELRALLTVSEAITRSARQRTESRGAHSRLDHPEPDDAHWGTRNSIVSLARDGGMAVKSTKLPKMSRELAGLLDGAH
jgi:succinate dehydrogenase / fumarate reductase flavoprotein subunit